MKLLTGICACGQRWWYTGDLETMPPCGRCGREGTRDDVRRKRAEREGQEATQ